MKNLYVSGYRSYEVSIFTEDDPKLHYIKLFFEKRLTDYIHDGLEWVIISGNIGTELWVGQVVLKLKKDYPDLKLAILLPYTGFQSKWNEKNQALFNSIVEKADYLNYTSNSAYSNPSQLKNHQDFIMRNTDGCLLFYDTEHEGKVKFYYDKAKSFQESTTYEIDLVSFDELQWFITDLEED
ncbi:MAG: DUF1273 domain-containing protein [Alkalibacterium sp.]|nr:DUF1273 domain-containing protein [Alkalibacterium sp.]